MSEGGKLKGWPHLAENILSSYVFCPQTSHVIRVFNAQLMCNATVCTLCAYIRAIACHDMTLVISQIYDDRLLTLVLCLALYNVCAYLLRFSKELLVDLLMHVFLFHSPCSSKQIKILNYLLKFQNFYKYPGESIRVKNVRWQLICYRIYVA